MTPATQDKAWKALGSPIRQGDVNKDVRGTLGETIWTQVLWLDLAVDVIYRGSQIVVGRRKPISEQHGVSQPL